MVGRPLSLLALAGGATVAASLLGAADAVTQGVQYPLTADASSLHSPPLPQSNYAESAATEASAWVPDTGSAAAPSSAMWGRLVRREAIAGEDMAWRHVADAGQLELASSGGGEPSQEILERAGGANGRQTFVEATSSSLPPGWEAAKDPASGREYYYNKGMNISQWTRPEQVTNSDDTIDQRSHQSHNATPGDAATPSSGASASSNEGGHTVQGGHTVVHASSPKLEVSSSEKLRMEEHSSDCMLHDSPEFCLKKFGTTTVKRLQTQTWEEITDRIWERPRWMAHDAVKSRKLLDVTFPGTHASASFAFKPGTGGIAGTFSVDGIQKQHLNIQQQLDLGIRAFDLPICTDFENGNKLWVCDQLLLVPLGEVLDELAAFLQRETSEVIVVLAKIGEARHTTALENVDPRYSEFLQQEATRQENLPGQSVHNEFLNRLGELILTYGVLERLPANETWENPKISSLVAANARVIYFWETQQVLCTTVKACEITPMWDAAASNLVRSNMITFQPLPMGSRPEKGGYKSAEPLCAAVSSKLTQNAQPAYLVENIKKWSGAIPSELSQMLPKCFPIGGKVPEKHAPPVLFVAEAFVSTHVSKVNFKEMRPNFLCGVGEGLSQNDTMKCKNFYSPFECFVSKEVCFQKLLPMMDTNCKEGDGSLPAGARCCGPYFNFKKDGEVAGACSCPAANSVAAKSRCTEGTAVSDVKVYELVAEGQESPAPLANTSMATALGDNFTIMSVAEHVNYLLLSWYMQQNKSAMFTAPTVVMVDFVHPVLVHRIVESMQGARDCGYAFLCNDTGSCNAESILRRTEAKAEDEAEDVDADVWGECKSEMEAENDLKYTLQDNEKFAAIMCLVVILCCLAAMLTSMMKGSPPEEKEEDAEGEKDSAGGEAPGGAVEEAEEPRRGSRRSMRAPVFSGTGETEPAAAPAMAPATAPATAPAAAPAPVPEPAAAPAMAPSTEPATAPAAAGEDAGAPAPAAAGEGAGAPAPAPAAGTAGPGDGAAVQSTAAEDEGF